MPLQLLRPTETHLPQHGRGITSSDFVINHVQEKLTFFHVKYGFSKFYIGTTSTNTLEERLKSHQQKKAGFSWMVIVYEEPSIVHAGTLDQIEKDAIKHFKGGLKPRLGRESADGKEIPAGVHMDCINEVSGIDPKNYLYILLGHQDRCRQKDCVVNMQSRWTSSP